MRRKLLLMIAAVFVLSAVVAAQGPAGAGVGTRRSSHSTTRAYSRSDFTQWQVAVGYQYNRINLVGRPFNTDGVNASVTRYFGRWFGVDGQIGAGFFGDTGGTSAPPNLGVHSLFLGGGPRLAYRSRSRVEPWIHAVIGLQDFRFTQTAGILGSNRALGGAAGGGIDYTLGPHLALRAEVDSMETHFFSTYQRHFQVVTGFAFNF